MNTGWLPPIPAGIKHRIESDLLEDIGTGDLSAASLPSYKVAAFYIEAQAPGRLCGAGLAHQVFDSSPDVQVLLNDGDPVAPGTKILDGRLPIQFLLSRERLALNYLMQLSGIATLTHQYCEAVLGTGCQIIDTRKTTPGFRALQKYAVRCGGGQNHRMGLYDGIMIKDNHIRAAGSVKSAIEAAKKYATHMTKIEVECENIMMVADAVEAGADIVMLDNMTPSDMAKVVENYKDKVVLEASGGINLQTVREVAQTGVHAISVGALTHSAPSLNLHLELK